MVSNPDSHRPCGFRLLSSLALLCLLLGVANSQDGPTGLADLFGTGQWRLVSFTVGGEEQPAIAGLETSFVVNVAGRLAGTVGCNQMVAAAELGSDGTASFGPVTSTLMACPEPAMSQERAFIEALEAVERYQRDAGTIVLGGPDVELVFAAAAPGSAPGEDGPDEQQGEAGEGPAGADDVAAFNDAVAAAAAAGAPWTNDPLRVALALVTLNGAPDTTITLAVSEPEGAGTATVTVEEHGLLDDSVEGLRQVVELRRSGERWEATSRVSVWYCRRGPDPEVLAPGVCP